MPIYRVLSMIEHNLIQYWPENEKAPAMAPSFSHGGAVPVDGSGSIELSEDEAVHLMRSKAVEPLKAAPLKPAKGIVERVEEFVEEEVGALTGSGKKKK
jgi:hypothetical protein